MIRLLVVLLLLATPAAADIYRPVTSYEQAFTATSSTAPERTGDYITAVRLLCDADCNVAFAASSGELVEAASGAIRLEADVPEYFRISPNSQIFVGAWGNGNLYITEVE